MGEAEFFSDESYGEFWDIEPPEEFEWIYRTFLEIYRTCDERISFTDIKSWSDLRCVRLTQYEVDLIIAMNAWAADEISMLRDGED